MLKINKDLKIEDEFLDQVSKLIDEEDFSQIINISYRYYKENTIRLTTRDILASGMKSFLYIEKLNERDNSYGIAILDEESNKWYIFKDTQYNGTLMVRCHVMSKEKHHLINSDKTNVPIDFSQSFLDKVKELRNSNFNSGTKEYKDNSNPYQYVKN